MNITTHPNTKEAMKFDFRSLIFFNTWSSVSCLISWLTFSGTADSIGVSRFFPSRLIHHPSRYNLMMCFFFFFLWFLNVTLVTNNLSLAFKPSCVHTSSSPNKNNIELVFVCHIWLLIHTTATVFVNTNANKTPFVHESFFHICLKHW